MARNLIWPLGSTHIFTQWGWLILFIPDPFSGQHQIGESPPNTLFLRTFSKRTDVLTVCSFHSSSIMTPWGKPSNLWTSWVYSLRPRVPSWILDVFNLPHTGTPLSRLQFWLCPLRRNIIRSDIQLLHPWATFSGDIHASLPKQPGPHIYGGLHHSCP